jgi:DNA-binding GntR family transcriptional regulator
MVQHTGRPAYLQIADELREQIRSGQFAPGDVLPSPVQLADQFESSASVVKMAVGILRNEGLVVGQQGKGVFVRTSDDPPPQEPTGALDVIRDELRALTDRVAQVEQALAESGDAKKKRGRG